MISISLSLFKLVFLLPIEALLQFLPLSPLIPATTERYQRSAFFYYAVNVGITTYDTAPTSPLQQEFKIVDVTSTRIIDVHLIESDHVLRTLDYSQLGIHR